jgi:hypothetical protein
MLKLFSKHYPEMECQIRLYSYNILINVLCLVLH